MSSVDDLRRSIARAERRLQERDEPVEGATEEASGWINAFNRSQIEAALEFDRQQLDERLSVDLELHFEGGAVVGHFVPASFLSDATDRVQRVYRSSLAAMHEGGRAAQSLSVTARQGSMVLGFRSSLGQLEIEPSSQERAMGSVGEALRVAASGDELSVSSYGATLGLEQAKSLIAMFRRLALANIDTRFAVRVRDREWSGLLTATAARSAALALREAAGIELLERVPGHLNEVQQTPPRAGIVRAADGKTMSAIVDDEALLERAHSMFGSDVLATFMVTTWQTGSGDIRQRTELLDLEQVPTGGG